MLSQEEREEQYWQNQTWWKNDFCWIYIIGCLGFIAIIVGIFVERFC